MNVSQTLTCTVAAGLALAPALIGNTAGHDAIFAPGAELKELFNSAHFTEGVSVAPDGTVYFSDITFTDQTDMKAGNIWKHNPETGETTIFRSPSGMSNGTKFDAQGRLVVAEGADFGGRRITRTDMTTGKSEIVAGLYNGKPFNSPNDLSIDEQGRIYFTDPRYAGDEPVEQPIFGVYRIDTDGSVHLVVTDAGKPNGVAVSPDQKTLYVISHDNGAMGSFPDEVPLHKGRMALLAYDLSPEGTATFREVLVDYAPQDGPDGMVVDAEGNLFVAVRDETRPGVCVYTPEGEELAYVKTPDKPTNVAFGRGETSKVLYITAEHCLYSIQTLKEGYHLPQK